MLGHGLLHGLVDWQQGLACPPVPAENRLATRNPGDLVGQAPNRLNTHFANELTSERVNNTGYGRRLALANEVEIEHALHSTRLETAVLKLQLVSYSGFYFRSIRGGKLTRRSIVSLGGRECARPGGSAACWELRNGECCRLQTDHPQ